MALLLNIDTATEIASISISENKTVIGSLTNNDQKDHASFLQPAIKNLLLNAHLPINKLNAIAVTAGPGSYTGLRVGMASAKGLCYALNIPLITISTLEAMALSSVKQMHAPSALYCPMIDARRMEVFTAVYDHHLTEIIKPCAMILDGEAFKELLEKNKIYFSGSGTAKLKDILDNKNAAYIANEFSPSSMAELSYGHYKKKNFANITYAAPVYLKEFYTQFAGG
ncbi:MAG TPA: tRNA (adenosine(37)-N6)-threonylcarbamoyltransferase complex dimerization subunit type 1 TsaB [Chitinophagaceae bacterium]